MPIRPIITGSDNPTLCSKTRKVTEFGVRSRGLTADLLDTVAFARGAGLAAPQIGDSSRAAVAKIGGEFVLLINPEIVWRSEETNIAEEGCLSLPDAWIMVPRASEIIVRYRDEKGEEGERKLSGWDARVVQHEADHLEGRLISDYRAAEGSVPGGTDPLEGA